MPPVLPLLQSLYETSGWLALLVFGVPILVISVVCYALCCMEPFDDTIFEREGEEEEEGEKKALTEGTKCYSPSFCYCYLSIIL